MTEETYFCPICKKESKIDYVLKSDSKGYVLYSPKSKEYIIGTTPLGVPWAATFETQPHNTGF